MQRTLRHSIRNLLTGGLVLLTVACSAPQLTHAPRPGLSAKRISVMTFNVENLFDGVHDEGKRDHTYMPLFMKKHTKGLQQICDQNRFQMWVDECMQLDWNRATLDAKMANLARTIFSVNNGHGPDMIVLQEVENIRILEHFKRRFLSRGNYLPAVLLEGRDKRGIDVAVLSRIPLNADPKLHYVDFQGIADTDKKDTRPILEARFMLPSGDRVTVFAAHFPAPFHDKKFRIQSFQKLRELQRQTDGYVIAAGDFNVPSEEDKRFQILGNYVEPDWLIAHKYCLGSCKGTNYYAKKDSWSFLDMILLSKNFSDGAGWELDIKSVKVANEYTGHVTSQGTPKRYDPIAKEGVSDHWPIYLEIYRN